MIRTKIETIQELIRDRGTPPKILQVSGLTWRRSGTTVADIQVGGQPLDDARTYTVFSAVETGASA